MRVEVPLEGEDVGNGLLDVMRLVEDYKDWHGHNGDLVYEAGVESTDLDPEKAFSKVPLSGYLAVHRTEGNGSPERTFPLLTYPRDFILPLKDTWHVSADLEIEGYDTATGIYGHAAGETVEGAVEGLEDVDVGVYLMVMGTGLLLEYSGPADGFYLDFDRDYEGEVSMEDWEEVEGIVSGELAPDLEKFLEQELGDAEAGEPLPEDEIEAVMDELERAVEDPDWEEDETSLESILRDIREEHRDEYQHERY